MRRPIRFVELELESFGVWQKRTRFRFPDRLATLRLPNESGKSTLIAGLRAVLFGLPGRTDPTERGIARFRSWGTSNRFAGRLDIAVQTHSFRIRRDFLSHETTLERLDASGRTTEPIFSGNANPDGRTASPLRYRETLSNLLGDLADEDLFTVSFLVAQPIIPAGEMGDALQRLVSGVGQVSGGEARSVLFHEAKALTRLTGDRGLIAPGSKRPANQRTDGQIEQLEREIAELEGASASAVVDFDHLTRLEKERDAAAEESETTETELKHARADFERLQEYRRHVEDQRSAREARNDLQRVLESHDRLMAKAGKHRQILDEKYNGFAEPSEELNEVIEQAIELEQLRERLIDTEKRQEKALEGVSGRIDQLRSLSIFKGMGKDGSNLVARLAALRQSVGHWTKQVDRFLELNRNLVEMQGARSRFSPIAVLPDPVLDSLANLDTRLHELTQKETMADRLSSAQQMRLNEHVRHREEFDRLYGSLDGIDIEATLSFLEVRSTIHRRIASLRQQLYEMDSEPRVRRSLWRRLGIGIPIALTVSLVGITLPISPGVATAIGFLVLISTVLLMSLPSVGANRRAKSELESSLASLHSKLETVPLPAGPWLPDDAEAVDRARDMVQRRSRLAETLEGEERDLPSPEAVSEAARTCIESREQRLKLERQAMQIEKSLGLSAPDAIREYRETHASLAALESRRQSLWSDLVGPNQPSLGLSDSDQDPLGIRLDELSDTGHDLSDLASMLDLDQPTLRTLYDYLQKTPPAQWDAWESDARGLSETKTHSEHIEQSLAKTREQILEVDRKIAEAHDRIGPELLSRAHQSARELRDQLADRAEIMRLVEVAEQPAAGLLENARGGPYTDRGELSQALEQFDDRRRDAQKNVDETLEKSELVRSYAHADAKEQDRIARDLDQRFADAQVAHETASGREVRVKATLETWKPSSLQNIAALELEIANRKRELSTLRDRCEAICRAWHLIGEAMAEFSAAHRDELEKGLDGRFQRITGCGGRRISIDEEFSVVVLQDGLAHSESQLSQGARDQLAICLRLAVSDLLAGDLLLPLVLDDPFVHCDSERLVRIREAVEKAAGERQILLLTQDERIAGWGESISVESV